MRFRKVRFWSGCLLSLILGLLVSLSAFGQVATRGSLAGSVIDPTGAVVVGAAVTANNPATGERIRATTDAQGAFTFPSLAVGRYTVTVEAAGFKRASVTNVVIEVSTPSKVAITLEVGSTAEEITVAGGAQEVVNTSSPTLTNVVERKQIVDLPLLERNPMDLVRLQAGIVTPNGNEFGTGGIGAVAVGLRSNSTNITQDGVNAMNNTDRRRSFEAVSAPSVEATGEFSVSVGTVGSDSGRGVAQIRIVTPSGKNEFHGSLFNFHRNGALNANSFFNNSSNTPRNFQIQNRFGFTASGPVYLPKPIFGPVGYDGRNRSFWFLSYQGFREPRTSTDTRTVLTQQARQGIFRYIGADGQLKTVNLLAVSTSPLAGAHILNPVTKAQIDLTPLPNSTLAGDGLNTGGFRFNSSRRTNSDKWSLRLDQSLTESSPIGAHKLEAVIHRTTSSDSPIDSAPFPGVGNILSETENVTVAAAAIHSTFGAVATNEVRFGVQRDPFSNFRSEPPAQPFFIDFQSFTDPIQQSLGFQIFNTASHFQDNFSLVKGPHTFRMGAEFQSLGVNFTTPAGVHPLISLTASSINPDRIPNTAFPSLPNPATADRARNIFRDITGWLNSVTQTFNVTGPDSGFVPGAPINPILRQREWSFYFQDQWRMRRNFTLNYGLRYELIGVPVVVNRLTLQPVNGVASLFGISGPNNLFKPGLLQGTSPQLLDFAGGPDDPPLYNQDRNNFAPFLGFAYSPNFERGLLRRLFGAEGKSSIRAGFSISYLRDGLSVVGNFLGTSGTLRGIINPGLGLPVTNTNLLGALPAGGITVPTPTFKAPITDLEIGQRTPTNGMAAFDPNLRTPYVQQWSFGIEREIARDWGVEARYVGNRAVKLYRGFDINEPNIFENGFLKDFLTAQKNLAIFVAANPQCGQPGRPPCTFANVGLPGQAATPVFSALFAGPISTAAFTNSTFINNLIQNNVGTMATAITINPLFKANTDRLAPNFFRANPNVFFAIVLGNPSFSSYHALQLETRRRFSKGLSFQANYTFSKAITDSEGGLGLAGADANIAAFQAYSTIRNTGLDRHRAVFDITHNAVANFIYELPFGPKRRFLNGGPRLIRKMLEGWQTQGIVQWHTGRPLDVPSARTTVTFQTFVANNPAVLLGGLSEEEFARNVGVFKTPQGVFFFNPQFLNITTAADGTRTVSLKEGILGSPPPGEFGTIPRGLVNAPSFFQVDGGLLKRTAFSERGNVEFRLEFFNIFNSVNFNPATLDFNNARFGLITGTSGARVGQAALRINW
jgi:carboxypeptidase family protein